MPSSDANNPWARLPPVPDEQRNRVRLDPGAAAELDALVCAAESSFRLWFLSRAKDYFYPETAQLISETLRLTITKHFDNCVKRGIIGPLEHQYPCLWSAHSFFVLRMGLAVWPRWSPESRTTTLNNCITATKIFRTKECMLLLNALKSINCKTENIEFIKPFIVDAANSLPLDKDAFVRDKLEHMCWAIRCSGMTEEKRVKEQDYRSAGKNYKLPPRKEDIPAFFPEPWLDDGTTNESTTVDGADDTSSIDENAKKDKKKTKKEYEDKLALDLSAALSAPSEDDNNTNDKNQKSDPKKSPKQQQHQSSKKKEKKQPHLLDDDDMMIMDEPDEFEKQVLKQNRKNQQGKKDDENSSSDADDEERVPIIVRGTNGNNNNTNSNNNNNNNMMMMMGTAPTSASEQQLDVDNVDFDTSYNDLNNNRDFRIHSTGAKPLMLQQNQPRQQQQQQQQQMKPVGVLRRARGINSHDLMSSPPPNSGVPQHTHFMSPTAYNQQQQRMLQQNAAAGTNSNSNNNRGAPYANLFGNNNNQQQQQPAQQQQVFNNNNNNSALSAQLQQQHQQMQMQVQPNTNNNIIVNNNRAGAFPQCISKYHRKYSQPNKHGSAECCWCTVCHMLEYLFNGCTRRCAWPHFPSEKKISLHLKNHPRIRDLAARRLVQLKLGRVLDPVDIDL